MDCQMEKEELPISANPPNSKDTATLKRTEDEISSTITVAPPPALKKRAKSSRSRHSKKAKKRTARPLDYLHDSSADDEDSDPDYVEKEHNKVYRSQVSSAETDGTRRPIRSNWRSPIGPDDKIVKTLMGMGGDDETDEGMKRDDEEAEDEEKVPEKPETQKSLTARRENLKREAAIEQIKIWGDDRPIYKTILVEEKGQKRYEHSLQSYCQGKTDDTLRNEMSRHVHDTINKSRLRTKAELDTMGWTYIEPGIPHYLVTNHGVRIFLFLAISAEMIFGLKDGILEGEEGLKAIQKIYAAPDLEARLKKMAHSNQAAFKGEAWDFGPTHQMGSRFNARGPILKHGDPEFCRASRIMTKHACTLLETFVSEDDQMVEAAKRYFVDNASISMSDENNFTLCGHQVNISPISMVPNGGRMLPGSIKSNGELHIDGNDVRHSLTVVINLSTDPADHFCGRFNLPAQRITVTTDPFSAVIFRGTLPHFTTGGGPYSPEAPLGSPLRMPIPEHLKDHWTPGLASKRIASVHFANRNLGNPYPLPRFTKDLVCDGAISLYQTQRHLNETRLRLAMKNAFMLEHPDEPKHPPPNTDPEYWYGQFSWINENGEQESVSRWIVDEKLKYRGREDPVLKKLHKDLQSVSCQVRYPKPLVLDENGNIPPVQYRANGRRKEPPPIYMKQPAEVRWNNVNGEMPPFQPTVDKVPGNPAWAPEVVPGPSDIRRGGLRRYFRPIV
ncbi:hypothetical protein GLAREA_11490 [Glarea lozoyensis ATCC 20868]|uniref:Uncharacterized protein n=1 Tax=Glarea lozoyensis (strain ATCC 20868 / MF5171) TaxID=1116229 RepID=S3CI18_GLAL2|nr:uncharacterized protein GLAREA_11490 [Glarea lozoyensis ATCC 20868]EPE24909.1 hypothetical protein GLAREA_11490 [Glarea lozoyensis ATCC 20868]